MGRARIWQQVPLQSHIHGIVPCRVTLPGYKIQGNSPRASLPVGVPVAKSNNQAKYVELAV